MAVKIKRIYEDVDQQDGIRILIDRLWPRGISKEKAKLDDWLKEIAPSDELRKYFGHQPEKFEVFKKRYQQELNTGEALEAYYKLKTIMTTTEKNITLIYAAKDEIYNNAQILKKELQHSLQS